MWSVLRRWERYRRNGLIVYWQHCGLTFIVTFGVFQTKSHFIFARDTNSFLQILQIFDIFNNVLISCDKTSKMPILSNMINLAAAPRDKYIENLSAYTKGELLELKARQFKLISSKWVIYLKFSLIPGFFSIWLEIVIIFRNFSQSMNSQFLVFTLNVNNQVIYQQITR